MLEKMEGFKDKIEEDIQIKDGMDKQVKNILYQLHQDKIDKNIGKQIEKTQSIFKKRFEMESEGVNNEIERNILYFCANEQKDKQKQYENLILKLTKIEERLRNK